MMLRSMRMNSVLGGGGAAPPMSPWKRNLMGQSPTPMRDQPPMPSFDLSPMQDVEEPVAPRSSSSRFYDELQNIRNEGTPGLTAYKEALNEMPTPDQYKPNWLTRIASGLSGFSSGMKDAGKGIQTAMSLNRAPYEQAMEEYSGRLGTLKEQAGMESEDRDTRLKSVQDAWEMGLKYEDFERKKEETAAKIETDRITANSAQTRAQAYAQAQGNPDTASVTQADGSVLVYNKKDPSQTWKLPANSIEAARLRDREKQTQIQAGNLGVAQTQAQTSRDVGMGNLKVAQDREAREGQNTKSLIDYRQSRPSPNMTPSAQKSARDLAVTELADDPTWARFATAKDPSDFSAEDWQDYQEELADRIAEIQRRGGR
jgi:hypothetical protein